MTVYNLSEAEGVNLSAYEPKEAHFYLDGDYICDLEDVTVWVSGNPHVERGLYDDPSAISVEGEYEIVAVKIFNVILTADAARQVFGEVVFEEAEKRLTQERVDDILKYGV